MTHPDRGIEVAQTARPGAKAAAQNDQVSAAHMQIINQLQAEQNGGSRADLASRSVTHCGVPAHPPGLAPAGRMSAGLGFYRAAPATTGRATEVTTAMPGRDHFGRRLATSI